MEYNVLKLNNVIAAIPATKVMEKKYITTRPIRNRNGMLGARVRWTLFPTPGNTGGIGRDQKQRKDTECKSRGIEDMDIAPSLPAHTLYEADGNHQN